jgi:hypothetical protein
MGRRNLARGDVRNPGSARKRLRAHECGRRKCCKLSTAEFVHILSTPTPLVAALPRCVLLRLSFSWCAVLPRCDLETITDAGSSGDLMQITVVHPHELKGPPPFLSKAAPCLVTCNSYLPLPCALLCGALLCRALLCCCLLCHCFLRGRFLRYCFLNNYLL